MTEQQCCDYPGDRTDALLTYLYADDDAGRSWLEPHLAACAVCRDELDALRGVRGRLAAWTPPEPARALSGGAPPPRVVRGPWRALAEIPVWAQIAAASLIMGVSVGIANLQVEVGDGGLTVRTGWSRSATTEVSQGVVTADAAPWRADLAALRSEVETELADVRTATVAAAPAARDDADAVMRQVRALIEESEHRHQRELALRVGEAMRDVNAQRRADLVNIDRSLGTLQNNLGLEMLKQREQMNSYALRVSSQK